MGDVGHVGRNLAALCLTMAALSLVAVMPTHRVSPSATAGNGAPSILYVPVDGHDLVRDGSPTNPLGAIQRALDQWARGESGGGVRQAYVNALQETRTTARNLRNPFRGIGRRFFGGYRGIGECSLDLGRIMLPFC